jgi:hypothetical protein
MPGPAYQPKPFITSSASPFFCEEPSASMNEKILGEIDPNDSLLQFVYEALKSVRVAAQGCTAACRAVHGDLTIPEGGRHVNADAISFKLTSKVLPLVDAANQKILAEITRLQNKIAQPVIDNTIRAVQVATELRLFLRDSTQADRRKEITKAIASGNDQTISAILSAPAMLSGLSPIEVDGVRLLWQQKRWPNELARLAQLEKVGGHLNTGGQLLISHQRKMSLPAITAEAKKFQQASAAAIAQASGAH